MSDMAEKIGTLLWTQLGDEPDQVARALAARGIKGFAYTGEHCPIAMLIRHEFPETDDDELWGWVYDTAGEDDPGRSPGYFVDVDRVDTPDGPVTLPPAVGDFIEAFDNDETGEYDALNAGIDLVEAEIASVVDEVARADR